MTDTRFTPGPLKVVNAIGDKDQICYVDVLQADGKYRGAIAQCHDAEHIDGVTREEMFANAHLIAAAPCMYQATDPFDELHRYHAADAPEWKDNDRVTVQLSIGDLRAIKAARAKARGEA